MDLLQILTWEKIQIAKQDLILFSHTVILKML